MKELTMTIKHLVEKCATENKCKNKVFKVYSNNQASFKTIRSMKSNNDQTRLRRIQKACETIRSRDANLELRWISKHKEIQNNENANIATKNVYKLSMSLETRREIVVLTMLIRIKIKKKWKSRWSNDTNKKHLRRLVSKITSKHMLLHKNKHKLYSALLTQLHIKKIDFNLFLKERCVLEVISETCSCDHDIMTMRHVLLTCWNWRNSYVLLGEIIHPLDIDYLSIIYRLSID